MLSRILLTLVVAMGLCLGATSAWAQRDIDSATRAEARRLYDAATDAYDRGDYQAALRDWLQAYEITGATVVLYGIGNAHERLGNLEAAIEALGRYRESLPNNEEKRLLEIRLDNLRDRLAQRNAEEQRRQEEEERRLREAEDRELRAREEQERLERELLSERLEQMRRDPPGLRVVRWTALSTAIAGATTGLVFTIRAESLASQLRDSCQPVDGGGLLCSETTRGNWDDHALSRRAANISYGVAGGFAALFLATAFIHPNRDITIDDISFEPVFYAGGAGMNWRTRF